MSGLDHPHRLWNIALRVRGQNLFGLPVITAGTENGMFGFRAAGIVRLILTLCGFHTAGSIVMAAGCWLKATGARACLKFKTTRAGFG